MYIFDSSGTNTKKRGFSSLITTAGLPGGGYFYDPRVIYEPKYNRFIVAILYGADPLTSRLVICISNTADPGGTWNFFIIQGGLGNNNLWMDFPNMGQSESEIFISANLFNDRGESAEGVILQIDKSSLLSGNILYKSWTSIDGILLAFAQPPVRVSLK